MELCKRQTNTEPPERDTHIETEIKARTMMSVGHCGRIWRVKFTVPAHYLRLRQLWGRALQLSLARDWLLIVWRVIHSRASIGVEVRLS